MEEQNQKLVPATEAVVVAASAGGLAALTELLSGLPADLNAAVVVVLHRSSKQTNHLAAILSSRTKIKVKDAQSGEQLTAGTVYVAPTDLHLIIEPGGVFSLSREARENYVRPAADVRFRSAAQVYGDRLAGVMLPGRGRDGSAGLSAIHRAGGATIAQNQATSDHFGMPGAAIATGDVGSVLPLSEIASALVDLTKTSRAHKMSAEPRDDGFDELLKYL